MEYRYDTNDFKVTEINNANDKKTALLKFLMVKCITFSFLKLLEIIDELEGEIPSNSEDYTKQPGYIHEDDIETIEIVDEDERNEEKENYYTDFITSKVKNKKWLNKQTIYKIHKTPREWERPRHRSRFHRRGPPTLPPSTTAPPW